MSEAPWTVRRVLGFTTAHFDKRSVDAPRLAAELLLAHVLGVDRVRLYTDLDRPLQKEELAAYRALIARRVEGEPMQYLTGRRDFYGRTFQVDSRVLIPRPETELLVEAVLRALPKGGTAEASRRRHRQRLHRRDAGRRAPRGHGGGHGRRRGLLRPGARQRRGGRGFRPGGRPGRGPLHPGGDGGRL